MTTTPPDVVEHVPDVHRHPRGDPTVAQPEGDELPAVAVPAHDHLVVGRAEPDVLHAEVVLVGEEVRHPLVAHVLAEHRPCRGRPLIQRVGPVLDPHVPVVERVERRRDVPGCEHVGGRRPECRVGDDGVVVRDAA